MVDTLDMTHGSDAERTVQTARCLACRQFVSLGPTGEIVPHYVQDTAHPCPAGDLRKEYPCEHCGATNVYATEDSPMHCSGCDRWYDGPTAYEEAPLLAAKMARAMGLLR